LNVELYYMFGPYVDIIMYSQKFGEEYVYKKNSFINTLNINSNRGTHFSEYTDRIAIFS